MNRVSSGYSSWGGSNVRQQFTVSKVELNKTRLAFKMLSLIAITILLALFYIWSKFQIIETGYEINELEKQRTVLNNTGKILQVELSLLESPERLNGIASQKLKMNLPHQSQIFELKN